MDNQNKKADSFILYSKWTITALFTLSICYKIITSDLELDLSGFTFTDLLSLILAMFAIWISINFYHNNNLTSNKFYNNTYNFTKDISETLGRIEERFGEKLESIKDENKSLSTRMDRYYSSFPKNEDEEKAEQEKLGKIKEELEIKNKELSLTIQELTDKYKVTAEDKDKFVKELKSKNEEIKKLKRKEFLFNSDLKEINNLKELPRGLISYGIRMFKEKNFTDLYNQLPEIDKKYIFKFLANQINPDFLIDLEKFDIIDSEKLLTNKGEEYIKRIAL